MREPIDHLFRAIEYSFKDQRLAEYALTHRSVSGSNNERLEFLGDAILGFVIADELYAKFQGADEGRLSRMRASLVKGESLAALARELDLGHYLILGTGELRSGGQSRDSILADALEAIFAAIYLDGGEEAARRVILKLFGQRLNSISPEKHQKDPKTQLQEYLQARGLSLPTYQIIDISGEQHDQIFQIECAVQDLLLQATGVGGSRRKAEQDAASKLLQALAEKNI